MIRRRKVIRDVRIRAHLWPALFRGIISCLVISWRNHSWRVDRRLLIQRLFGDGSSKVGNNRESRISGIPNSWGLAN